MKQDTPDRSNQGADMNRNDLGTQFEITPDDRDVIADVIVVWA